MVLQLLPAVTAGKYHWSSVVMCCMWISIGQSCDYRYWYYLYDFKISKKKLSLVKFLEFRFSYKLG